MTIRKGEPWGRTIERSPGIRTVDTDAAIGELVVAGADGPIGVSGGDLHRSLGSPTVRDEMLLLPIDVLQIVAGDLRTVAVAHVVARGSWWRGAIVAVCNVDRIGDWNVAPRAHPNDGRADVIEVDRSMTVRERWQARQRLPTGTHVPHPRITTSTTTDRSWTFDRPHAIWVDGSQVTVADSVSVAVVPDAIEIVV